MEKSTPQLWNHVWKDTPSFEEDLLSLVKEENSIRWQRIEKIVEKCFGSFSGIEVIELGAGTGINAALMAKRGAQVTVLDFSELAIERARDFFKRNVLTATFIKQDAFSLPPEMQNQYDISMSFGLTEHFTGSKRLEINKVHFDLLRRGGVTFISVPNKYNVPYRIFKYVAECAGKWKVGEEHPYSRREMARICKKIGIKEYAFFGDSTVSSFNFISPFRLMRKMFKLGKSSRAVSRTKQKGTFLDQYIGYALVLYGKK